MPRSPKLIKTTPATDEEIDALLKESGVESLDEIPAGSQVFHGWEEFMAESMCDLLERLEPSPERDRLRQGALASGRRIDAAYEDEGEGRRQGLKDAFDAHLELLQEAIDKLKAQEGEGHG